MVKRQSIVTSACKFLAHAAFLLTTTTGLVAEGNEVARLDSVEGDTEIRKNGTEQFSPASVGTIFEAHDTVRTSKNSRAGILFSSGAILRLAPGTSLTFGDVQGENPGTRKISMDAGKIHFFEREPSELPEFSTPAVTTAVRGTEFVLTADSQHTEVGVLNGTVECLNQYGTTWATGGEQITTKLGEAPVKGILVSQTDAVQWSLYYPRLGEVSSLSPSPAKELLSSVEHNLAIGDVRAAEMSLATLNVELEKLPDSADRAKAKSLSLAQSSIIETVRDRKERGMSLAKKGWESAPTSSAALATAYAFQAEGKLSDANIWFAKASSLNTSSSLPIARQAELAMGFGDVDKASQMAQEALALNPDDSYALSVDGFAELLKDNRPAAISRFNGAITKTPGLGLPHLGLGLTLIRSGKLKQGRLELEKAVVLEPNNALFRSYLGKAFFEEEREDSALEEYNQSIALDPGDPTPYLYRAYSQLSANKPVAALRDVEKSIELNNHRAVYRSSLLLDQDLGVRSAGLAEVFTSLGFAEAARIEAIKSINHDYNNYSAHRMLADSYNNVFLSDARVSQIKIATLLAPLNLNLLAQGSATGSLNEYNSLFDRDQNRIDVGGQYGSDVNRRGGDATFSGKQEKFGYLLGYEGFSDDPSGVGNDSQLHRGRFAVQYQPDYKDLFLLDAKGGYRNETANGFDPQQTSFDDYEVDLGFRHSFSAASTLLLETTYQDQINRFESRDVERSIALTQLSAGEIAEFDDLLLINETSREHVRSGRHTAQWIYDSPLVSAVTGGQLYEANAHRRTDTPVVYDEEGVFTDLQYQLDSDSFNQLHSSDVYSYTNWHFADWIDVNVGASYSDVELEAREVAPFDQKTYSRSHLNPKAGVTLYPTDALTLRGAFFETLRKSSLEDSTSLEPTLVGGFNQRYTDLSGDLGRTLALGADYKIAAFTYVGVEGLRRHVRDTLNGAQSTVSLDYDTLTAENGIQYSDPYDLHNEQNIARAYLYQVFSDQFVGTINEEWSKFQIEDPNYGQDLQLDKTAVGLRYLDPDGWYVATEATRRQQRREGSSFEIDGSDGFWLFDAALGYRLPARHGVVELRVGNIFDRHFTYDQSIGSEDFVRNNADVMIVFKLREWN